MLIDRLEKTCQLHKFVPGQSPEFMECIAPAIQAIVATGESRVTADFLARFPAAKILAVFGVGYDGVDTAAAHALGMSVTHTPDVLTDNVADLAIALMLATARAVPLQSWSAGPCWIDTDACLFEELKHAPNICACEDGPQPWRDGPKHFA